MRLRKFSTVLVVMSAACSSGHPNASRPSTTTAKAAAAGQQTPPRWLEAGLPLPVGDVLAWRYDGRLVVIDPHTRHERLLTRVPTGLPGRGPSGVTLSPDRRTAYVSWQRDEFACSQMGAIRTDGHGRLRRIDIGTGPKVSPDGRRLAYFRAAGASGGCTDESIVVVDLHDGTQRNITIGHTDGYSYSGGPWWRADSRDLIAPITDPLNGPSIVRELDTTTATSIRDASRIDSACGVHIDIAHSPIGITRDDHMILTDTTANVNPLTSCDLHTQRAQRLTTGTDRPNPFAWSIAGHGLVFVDTKGDLWRSDATDAAPTQIATGPFQSAAA